MPMYAGGQQQFIETPVQAPALDIGVHAAVAQEQPVQAGARDAQRSRDRFRRQMSGIEVALDMFLTSRRMPLRTTCRAGPSSSPSRSVDRLPLSRIRPAFTEADISSRVRLEACCASCDRCEASMRVAPRPGSNSVPCSLRLRSAVGRRSRGTVRVMVEMSVVRVSSVCPRSSRPIEPARISTGFCHSRPGCRPRRTAGSADGRPGCGARPARCAGAARWPSRYCG